MFSSGIRLTTLVLAACLPLAFPLGLRGETCPSPELRTSGINYDVTQVAPGDVSTAALNFQVTANFSGQSIEIASATCGSGCRKQTQTQNLLSVSSGSESGGENLYDVFIVRFAKSGRYDEGGFAFDWLVRMEDCDGLAGTLRVPANGQGQSVYPGHLALSGRMVISIRLQGATEVINLRSRTSPLLEGTVHGWPPYGLVLNLTNGPIPYYDERQIDDPNAQPFLVVTGNQVTLGTTESGFQKHAPEIVSTVAGPGGLQLTWNGTAGLTECPLGAYHVYRNTTPGQLDGWTLAGSVPASQTSFVDAGYDGTPTEYMVVHATTFNFGFEYEGGLGEPVLVP